MRVNIHTRIGESWFSRLRLSTKDGGTDRAPGQPGKPPLKAAREAANRIGAFRPQVADCLILGPAPAPMALLRGRYRYRFLINARRSVQLQDVIRNWLGRIDHPPGVRVAVDVDPYSFV